MIVYVPASRTFTIETDDDADELFREGERLRLKTIENKEPPPLWIVDFERTHGPLNTYNYYFCLEQIFYSLARYYHTRKL